MTSAERPMQQPSDSTRSSQPSTGAPTGASGEAGFLPRAQQLGAKAFADGTKVMEDASSFVRTVHQISQEAETSLSHSMAHRPYIALGTAATVGFVLGRGLTFGMSRTLFGMGGKLAMSLLIKRVTSSVF